MGSFITSEPAGWHSSGCNGAHITPMQAEINGPGWLLHNSVSCGRQTPEQGGLPYSDLCGQNSLSQVIHSFTNTIISVWFPDEKTKL